MEKRAHQSATITKPILVWKTGSPVSMPPDTIRPTTSRKGTTDTGYDKEQQAEEILALLHQRQCTGKEKTKEEKCEQVPLLGPMIIGHCSQYGGQ